MTTINITELGENKTTIPSTKRKPKSAPRVRVVKPRPDAETMRAALDLMKLGTSDRDWILDLIKSSVDDERSKNALNRGPTSLSVVGGTAARGRM